MENPFKKALENVLKKNKGEEPLKEEYKDSESEIFPEDFHAKETLPDSSDLEPIIKNESLEDLMDSLNEVEDNEIYYMKLKADFAELKKKLEDLNLDKALSRTQEEKDHIITEIVLIKQEIKDIRKELKDKEEILEVNPSLIRTLEDELEEYEAFIQLYYDQSDNYFNN